MAQPVRPRDDVEEGGLAVKVRIDEIAELRRRTLDGARAAAVAKQRERSKLTARERLALLCDGEVLEYGQLASSRKVTERATPADGVITFYVGRRQERWQIGQAMDALALAETDLGAMSGGEC